MGAYLDRWLRDYTEINLAPRTTEGYEIIIRYHLKPAMGKIKLDKLTTANLQEYYAAKLKSCSAQTIKHHHTLIHKALETAIEWGIIGRNVADRAKPPWVVKEEMQTCNEIEMNAFLEIAKGSMWYAPFYTLLYTGMRRSELLALRWGDIDTVLSTIYVNRSIHRRTTGEFVYRSPKTAKSKRSIIMSPSLYSVLQDHHAAMVADGKQITDSSLVFSDKKENPLLPSSVSHAWTRISKKAGVKPIRLHDSRHTHASLLLKSGVHPKIVQERLGHSSIQITLDLYSHLSPGL